MPEQKVSRAELERLLPGAEVHIFDTIGSTNQWLLERAERSFGDVFCLAHTQHLGRGRRGKGWQSPRGSFYGSAMLPMRGSAARIGPFSLAVASALAGVLEGFGVRGTGLKWPNDVQVDGKKIAGILLELSPHSLRSGAELSHRLVIGIGLNLEPVAADVGQAATSLREVLRGEMPTLQTVAAGIWTALRRCRDQFEAHGFAPFQPFWAERDALVDRVVLVTQGDARWRGTVLGLNPDGSLRVKADGVEHAISAGEVTVRAQ